MNEDIKGYCTVVGWKGPGWLFLRAGMIMLITLSGVKYCDLFIARESGMSF